MSFIRNAPAALLFVILLGCAGEAVREQDKNVAQEAHFQSAQALRSFHADHQRALNIFHAMSKAALPLCPGDVFHEPGLRIHSLLHYREAHWPVVKEVFGVSDDVSVWYVAPASPAASAGVQVGDIVLKLDGERVGSDRAGWSAFVQRMDAITQLGKAFEVVLRRKDEVFTLAISPALRCNVMVNLVNSENQGGFFAERTSLVTTASVRASSDDELAILLAHDIAHTLRHRDTASAARTDGALAKLALAGRQLAKLDASNTGDKALIREVEADYIGLYILALSGRPYTGAADYWRRVALASRVGHVEDHAKAFFARRVLELERMVSDFDARRGSEAAASAALAALGATGR